VHADRGQRLSDFVELEGFDDGDDEFHGSVSLPRAIDNPGVPDLPFAKSGIFLCKWHKNVAHQMKKHREVPPDCCPRYRLTRIFA
jgi:hypothetical protein